MRWADSEEHAVRSEWVQSVTELMPGRVGVA
jgi:hypothetical protein